MATHERERGVVELFDKWCEHYTNMVTQLEKVEENCKHTDSQLKITEAANLQLKTECTELQKAVKESHSQLHVVCDLEDNVRLLRKQIREKDQELQTKVLHHQVAFEKIKKTHKAEMEKNTAQLQFEYSKKLEEAEEKWRFERESKLALESQLETARKDNEKEISRITMEYENKLVRVQRQKAQFIQQQQQVLNQDVMRKKMYHMKENYDKEITSLKAKILELQQKQEIIQEEHLKENSISTPVYQHQKHFQQPHDDNQVSRETNKRKSKDHGLSVKKINRY